MEEELEISVNLQDVLEYIRSEEFINFLFNTTDISTGLFIQQVVYKTIEYMVMDENLQT